MYFPVCFAKNQLLVQLQFTSYSFKAIADLTQQPRGSRFPHSFGPAAVVEQCSSQHVVLCGWEKSTPIEIHGVWGNVGFHLGLCQFSVGRVKQRLAIWRWHRRIPKAFPICKRIQVSPWLWAAVFQPSSSQKTTCCACSSQTLNPRLPVLLSGAFWCFS